MHGDASDKGDAQAAAGSAEITGDDHAEGVVADGDGAVRRSLEARLNYRYLI